MKCLQTLNYSSRNSLHTDGESCKKMVETCCLVGESQKQLNWKRTWPLPLCLPNVCLNHNRPLCGTCAGVTRPIQQMDGRNGLRTETRRPRSEWLIGVWKCLLASTACKTLCSERDRSEKSPCQDNRNNQPQATATTTATTTTATAAAAAAAAAAV